MGFREWGVCGDKMSSEHEHQKALFNWAAMQCDMYCELSLMFAIPNGGHRHKRTAVRLKQEGVRAGVPDIFLPVARNNYHGLWIEMKYGKNLLTAHQRVWKSQLTDQGYCHQVYWDWQDAANGILAYLGYEATV